MINDIETWVENASKSKIKGFYHSWIAKQTGQNIDNVYNQLLQMVNKNKLNLCWEIICPECYRTCETISNDDFITFEEKEIECILGHEFIASKDMLNPIFEIRKLPHDKLPETA